MKVTNDRPVGPASRARAGGAASAGGAAKFATLVSDGGAGEAQNVAASRVVAAADALLAAQESSDFSAGRHKDFRRGNDLLDQLDDLRIGLLNGMVPREKLVALVRGLNVTRMAAGDRDLAAVLDEIDLRARVELAKLSIDP